MSALLNILNALPVALARWYYLNYIRPLILDEIRAEIAKVFARRQERLEEQVERVAHRYIEKR